MTSLFAFALGLAGALFPERWRKRLRLDGAFPIGALTFVSACLEIALGAALLYLGSAAYQGSRGIREPGVAVPGLDAFAELLFATPLGLVPIAMCLEGVIRALAGAVGQGCGVLPLWLLDRALHGSTSAIDSAREPRPEVDRVERRVDGEGKPAYLIRSSHDHGWTSLTTVELHGELWRVLEERHDLAAPMPHGWTLGPIPPGWMMRGAAVRYHPRAHLRREPVQRAERSQARREVAAELVRLPPLDVGALLALLLAPLVSLLPARTRARLRLDGIPVVLATFFTGLAQLALGAAGWPVLALDRALYAAPGVLVLYLLVEGVVRTLAGFAQIPCGTLIAWLIERAVLGSAHAITDLRELEPIRDELTPVLGGFEIASCRQRPWRETTTLAIAQVPHRIVRVEERPTELRPWLYTLEPTPAGWIDREWIDYDTGLVLEESARRPQDRDAPPG